MKGGKASVTARQISTPLDADNLIAMALPVSMPRFENKVAAYTPAAGEMAGKRMINLQILKSLYPDDHFAINDDIADRAKIVSLIVQLFEMHQNLGTVSPDTTLADFLKNMTEKSSENNSNPASSTIVAIERAKSLLDAAMPKGESSLFSQPELSEFIDESIIYELWMNFVSNKDVTNTPGQSGSGQTSGEPGQAPIRLSLLFADSTDLNINGYTELEIFDPSGSNQVVVNGDAEVLELSVYSFSQDNRIVLQINGHVGKIVLSGVISGDIVFTGTGKIGEIETDADLSDGQRIVFEGSLEVGTLNGQPVAEPSAPATSPAGSDSDSDSDSEPQPGSNRPSVTETVYSIVSPYEGKFAFKTVNTAKVYYVARHEEADAPDSEEVISEAKQGTLNKSGTSEVSNDGMAAILIRYLEEQENYKLYMVLEAPDGTLSDMYEYPFATHPLKIASVSHTIEDIQLKFTGSLNAMVNAAPVYWLLTTDLDAEYEPEEIERTVFNYCDTTYVVECGMSDVIETDSFQFQINGISPGTYRLHAAVQSRRWSPVFTYTVEVQNNW